MTGPKTTRLIEVLERLASLLADLDEGHWCGWMADAAQLLREGDYRGIGRVLEAYGGMGSFNDILPILVGEPADARADLARRLRVEVWTLAEGIRRDVESG